MDLVRVNKPVRHLLRPAQRRIATLGMVLTGIAWAGVAAAMPTCEGTYAATLLQPLPAQITVGLDIHDNSPRNQMLAERFLAGVREAGVAVGPQRNVLLHISTSRLGETANRPSGGKERSYPELSGLAGGPQVSLPAMPDTQLTVPRKPPVAPLMILRIDATVEPATRISWVASVQCRMIGGDEGQLAQDLGRVIGSALGRRIERQPI